jgi:hypothetical protein
MNFEGELCQVPLRSEIEAICEYRRLEALRIQAGCTRRSFEEPVSVELAPVLLFDDPDQLLWGILVVSHLGPFEAVSNLSLILVQADVFVAVDIVVFVDLSISMNYL